MRMLRPRGPSVPWRCWTQTAGPSLSQLRAHLVRLCQGSVKTSHLGAIKTNHFEVMIYAACAWLHEAR